MKIAIVGYSGAGKSTLAVQMGALFLLPVLHLDRVYWLPGWQERPKEEMNAQVKEFMDTHKEWVIDGNYTGTCFERRMEEADEIVFLDLPRLSCLYRALLRFHRMRGESRDSMAPGCPEKMDAAFLRWILFDGRTRAKRARMMAGLARFPQKAVHLHSQREIDAYVEKKQRESVKMYVKSTKSPAQG